MFPNEHAAGSGFTRTALEHSGATAAMGFETTPHAALERKPSYNWLESLPPTIASMYICLICFPQDLLHFAMQGMGI